ncbi:hypothetical protein ABW20_dc0110107 [Dactylellina cionopaga]|nr:hypothetical protein ABW20_dc0110107 [Dactylellina cionopaga]
MALADAYDYLSHIHPNINDTHEAKVPTTDKLAAEDDECNPQVSFRESDPNVQYSTTKCPLISDSPLFYSLEKPESDWHHSWMREKIKFEKEEAAQSLKGIHLIILILALTDNELRETIGTRYECGASSDDGSVESSDAGEESSGRSDTSRRTSGSRDRRRDSNSPSHKRSRTDKDEPGDDNEDESNRQSPKKQIIHAIQTVQIQLACPFAKASPDQYPGCQLKRRKDLSGIK